MLLSYHRLEMRSGHHAITEPVRLAVRTSVGQYTIEIAAGHGFAAAKYENVMVTVGAKTNVIVSLTVGGTTNVVDVINAGQGVELTRTSVSSTVNETQVANLPTNGGGSGSLAAGFSCSSARPPQLEASARARTRCIARCCNILGEHSRGGRRCPRNSSASDRLSDMCKDLHPAHARAVRPGSGMGPWSNDASCT